MIWLTWEQHRKQALFAVIGLAVLAGALILTGRQMYDTLAGTGLEGCLRKLGTAEFIERPAAGMCDAAAGKFENMYAAWTLPGALLVFLPLLAGLFWGAPLVAREVEHGTHRFVWTQDVTRLRWTVVKFGLVTAGAVVVAVAYALLVSWWLTPLTRIPNGSRFEFPFYDLFGLAPVGYTLFAIALGIFAGTVTRKVMPAMAITLVGFLAIRIAGVVARPAFQAPLERKFPVATSVVPNQSLGDWVLSQGVYDRAGALIQSNAVAICEPPSPSDQPGVGEGCHGAGAYNGWTYHPGDRFWLFQYIETGVYVALGVLLLLIAVHQVRRRIS